MPSTVTVIINAYNSAELIADCIQSALLLTPHVIVVDGESTDRTAHIAPVHGAHVVTYRRTGLYVEPARMYAISQAKTPWVFILDTDERITIELAREVQTILTSEPTHTHYSIPRKNIFAHATWLRHGGWWPDHQTRLLRVSELREWPSRIHSYPHITGTKAKLSHPIVHYFHGDVSGMVAKTIVFESVEADLLASAHRSATPLTFMRKYMGELYRRLIRHRGYMDGTYGILESLYQAYSKTITWLYVYEKRYINPPHTP